MQRSAGLIEGEDGYAYDFQSADWLSDEPPARGLAVDFRVGDDGRTASAVRVLTSTVDSRREPLAAPNRQRPVQQAVQHPPLPDNYLVWSIVVTILCCLPTGIVAIVYAAKVNSLHKNGQYQDAKDAANTAKSWIWGSVALGIGIGILVFIGQLGAV